MKPLEIKKRSPQFNRHQKPPAKAHPAMVRVAPARSLGLVMTNSAKIRREARKKYDSVRQQLDTVKLQIDEFQSLDLPAFNRWLHLRFGPLLGEIRELSGKIAQSERILHQVHRIAAMESISLRAAYQRYLAAEQTREERESIDPAESGESSGNAPPPGEPDDDGPDPFGPNAESDDPFEDIRNLFESMFGQLGGADPGKSADHKRQVKELYRKLARRLHPDAQGKVSDEMRSWWLQAQEAYQASDASQLELLLHLVEEKQGTPQQMTSVSSLYQMTTKLKATLRGMKRELRKNQRDRAWGCAKAPPDARIEREVEAELLRDLLPAKAHLFSLDREIEALKIPTVRVPRKPAKSKPSPPRPAPGSYSQDNFPF